MLPVASQTVSYLPEIDATYWLKVSPYYARINTGLRLIWLLFLLLFLALSPWLPFELPSWLFWSLLALALLWTLYLPYAFYRDRRMRYALCEHEFYWLHGWLWQSQICQPLKPVQHVSLEQGPIAKYFGLASLGLYSAGSPAASLTLPGLPLALAEQYRQLVLNYKREQHEYQQHES